MKEKQPLAIYIHYPFCLALCPYCDFNVYVKRTLTEEDYLTVMAQEIKKLAVGVGERRLTSIFFGGGTPSLLSPLAIEEILSGLAQVFSFEEKVEITLEVNPENAERNYFNALAQAGVNRLSLGVQSLQDKHLKFLGRKHNTTQARTAIDLGQKFFCSLSFDLIYAHSNQTLKEWQGELEQALLLSPAHLSLYQLELHPNTPFGKNIKALDENRAAELWLESEKRCQSAGLEAYEISNYAKAGHQSKHNLAYWRYENYAGLGPGAHGRLNFATRARARGGKAAQGFFATQTPRHPKQWATSVAEKDFFQHFACEKLRAAEQAKEKLLMGLRLRQGVAYTPNPEQAGNLKELMDLGLLEQAGGLLKATQAGALVLDSVVAALTR